MCHGCILVFMLTVSFVAYVVVIFFFNKEEDAIRPNYFSLKTIMVFVLNYFVFILVLTALAVTCIIVATVSPRTMCKGFGFRVTSNEKKRNIHIRGG